MLSLLKQCRGNMVRHVWPLSLCRICKGSVFLFFWDFIHCFRFLSYPFIISLSAAPMLWLCTVTPQSVNQDPISRGRLSSSSPQYTGNLSPSLLFQSGGLKWALLSNNSYVLRTLHQPKLSGRFAQQILTCICIIFLTVNNMALSDCPSCSCTGRACLHSYWFL